MTAVRSTLDARIAEKQKSVEFVEQTLQDATDSGRKLSEAELRQLDSHREIIEGLDADIAGLQRFLQVAESGVEIDKRLGGLGARSGAARTNPRPAQGLDGGAEFRSFGDLYVESEAFQERGTRASVQLEDVNITDLAMETRAVLTTTGNTSGNYGSTLLPLKQRFDQSQPILRTPLLDMVTKVPVDTGSVDILTWGEFAGADVVSEGATKPETLVVNGMTSLSLETVAGWVKYTRQLAEDATNFPDYLSRGITRDVLRKIQARLAAVILAATLPDTTGEAGAPLIEALRMGIADVQEAGFDPTVVIASPTVLAGLDISVLNLGGSAATLMGRGQWDLTPVGVPGFTKVIVADAASAFTLYTKNGMRIYTTDSDISGAGSTAASDFRANILTTLGEARAKGAIDNPNAATVVTVTPEA